MRRRDRLTVFGMALYGGIIFAVFLAWGMRSGAVNDLPGQERGAVFETISFGSKRNGSEPPKKTAGGISFSPRARGKTTPYCSASAFSGSYTNNVVLPFQKQSVRFAFERTNHETNEPRRLRCGEVVECVRTRATAPLGPLAKSNYGHIETTDRVIEADTLVYATPETVQVAEYLDECVEMPEVHVIEDCTVTYYCAEQYAHICGTGDGITATGARVTPGVTCAVDPSVIPFGSVVCVDYGDGVLHEYVAQDSGAWVNEDHIDICVETHSKALELGTRTATVYWETV